MKGFSLGSVQQFLGGDLPLWILGFLFLASGAMIGGAGLKMAQPDLDWSKSIATTGRVIITEWKREKNESRLVIVYGYKDRLGTIYHNRAMLARKLGKINLEPGAPVLVLYRPDDHALSRMQAELGSREWIPLTAIGFLEILFGTVLLAVVFKRLRKRLAQPA